jgi:hypothetical protein
MAVTQPDYISIASFITNAILGVSTLVLGIKNRNLIRKSKELTYAVLSDILVVSIHEEMTKKINISYGAVKVAKLRLIEIRVRNSGTEVINEEDFRVPLSFCDLLYPDAGNLIIFWDRVSITPENMKVELIVKDKRLGMSPVMLNPNDVINLKFVLLEMDKERSPKIRVEGRIVGTRLIEERPSDEKIGTDLIRRRFQTICYLLTIGLLVYIVTMAQDWKIFMFIIILSLLINIMFFVNHPEILRFLFVTKEDKN